MPTPQGASCLFGHPHLAYSWHSINVCGTYKWGQGPLHLGPSSCLGLGIHPVQLLQAPAQDVLDIFHKLLHLKGRGQGSGVHPGSFSSGTPGKWHVGYH